MKQGGSPALIIKKLTDIYNVLEDVYSAGSITDIQTAITNIGDGAGTIFIEAGTHVIDTPINVNLGGSLVIYGHGDNTILQPADGINVFNVTNCESLIIRNLKIDADNYTFLNPNTQAILVNEGSNNVVSIVDVTIDGDGANGVGVELQSDNNTISNCNITNMDKGIYVNNSNKHIIINNTISGSDKYGIHVDTADFCNISGNTLSNNDDSGIFILDSNYNNLFSNTLNSNIYGICADTIIGTIIDGNIIKSNTNDGIYMDTVTYSSITANIIDGNDSNSITAKAGLYITNNSNYNAISSNSINNNNNIGIGTGYGIYISNANCSENKFTDNNLLGNDVKWKDIGTNTDIMYYCDTAQDIQDAIDSIDAKSGTIVLLNQTYTLTGTINVNNNGLYVIKGEGEGSVIDCNGDRSAFNITSAKEGTTLSRFKIDATDLTSLLKKIININEGSDNKIICDNLIVTGDGTNGLGVSLSSDNCLVTKCFFENIKAGVFTSNSANNIITENICKNNDNGINNYFGSDCIITGNINSNNIIGIFNDRSSNSTIVENTCNHNERYGIYNYGSFNCTITGNACNENNIDDISDGAGIHLTDDCDYNTIVGNSCNNNANTGAGTAYGIHVNTADCNENIIGTNSTHNNDVNYLDTGTGTILFGDDTIYGVGWNGDLGTATKNAIYDKIQLVIAAAAANAFKTITGITNDVVADNVNDILTLAAAGGLTIVGTAATDTITFTNTITQYTDALAVAAILADDAYIKNDANDIMAGDLTVNNLITAGAVDGVDVSALETDVNGFPDELKNLTAGEIGQLENIGAELISAAEWGHVATLQDVASGASPTFNRITINNVGTVNTDAVRYDQLMSAIAGLSWQESVLSKDLTDPPGGEGVGDRYIVDTVAGGAWAGHEDDIAEYNGAGWDFTTPEEGWTVWVVDIDTNYIWNGAAWVEFGSTVSHNNTSGLQGGVATEYFHLNNAQHTEITTFFGATDITGGEAETLTDTSNADALHSHNYAAEAFKTITGITNDVVADVLADTLTFVAAGGLTIVGTAATDTITFTNTITQYTDALAIAAILADDAYVKIVGDAMTGALAMGANFITGIANGVNPQDAMAFGQKFTDANAVAAIEAAGLDFDTTITLGFVDDAVGVFVDRIYDEDNMVSNDEHGLITQQSAKKYTDDRLYDIGFSTNWSGITDKAPTVDKIYDQFIQVADEMTAIKYCLNFQGDWDATGGAAPNPAPGDGDYWIVTTAGVWDAVSWELLDWIVWENNSEKWYKVKYFRQLPKVIVKSSDSIQTAIDKVIYMGGGVVEISSGTFNDANDAFPLNINDAGAGLFLKIVGIGTSTIIDPNGDSKVFNVINIGKLMLEDFKIDITDFITATLECIDVSEAAGNLVIIDNITITGDGTNGYGIELNSNNVQIKNCNITLCARGINILSDNNTINNNTSSSHAHSGIYLSSADYNNLFSNKLNSNIHGIYGDTITGTIINENITKTNTQNGVYLVTSTYNTITANMIDGNDSNTANPQAGLYVDANCDNNNIMENSSINNNNAGAGVGHGIYIANANCNENIVRSNNLSGNDAKWKDVGTNTQMEYICSSGQDIQDAIDSIAAKAGTIKIVTGIIIINTTINVNGGGSYLFEGMGGSASILQLCAINTHMIDISDALDVSFINIKFDLTNHTGNPVPIKTGAIYINEINNNWVLINNCIFYYNGGLDYSVVPSGVISYSDNINISNSLFFGVWNGVYFNCSYSIVSNCIMECVISISFHTSSAHCICESNSISISPWMNSFGGIGIAGSYHNVIGNNLYDFNAYGIRVSEAYYCSIIGNVINQITSDLGQHTGCIRITNSSDYNLISNNIIKSFTNLDGGWNGYGIIIYTPCANNYICHNMIIDCDGDILDNGTNTILIDEHGILLDATPITDDTGQGERITATVDENTQGFGNAMHLDGDGHWIDAHADNATTAMPCMALALESGVGSKKLLLRGIIRDDDWNWTVGAAIYVSDTASGDLTETQPADTGEIVQFVGWALSADVIFFNPSNLWLEMK